MIRYFLSLLGFRNFRYLLCLLWAKIRTRNTRSLTDDGDLSQAERGVLRPLFDRTSSLQITASIKRENKPEMGGNSVRTAPKTKNDSKNSEAKARGMRDDDRMNEGGSNGSGEQDNGGSRNKSNRKQKNRSDKSNVNGDRKYGNGDDRNDGQKNGDIKDKGDGDQKSGSKRNKRDGDQKSESDRNNGNGEKKNNVQSKLGARLTIPTGPWEFQNPNGRKVNCGAFLNLKTVSKLGVYT